MTESKQQLYQKKNNFIFSVKIEFDEAYKFLPFGEIKRAYKSNPKLTPSFKAISLVMRFFKAGIIILSRTSLLKA